MSKRSLAVLFLFALVHGACGGNGSSSTGAGGSAGSGTSSGTTSSTTSGPCDEAWVCSPWETDGASDAATRVCTDANACGTENDRPFEETTLPALDLDYFKCNVEPILDRKCSMLGCHGTEQGRALRVYARGRKRLAGQMLSNPPCGGAASTPSDGCDGSNQCLCAAPHTEAEWRKNYDAARGFAIDSVGKPYPANKIDKSDLLAQPVVGGEAHAGIHLFDKSGSEYATLKNWLTGAALGMPCNTGAN
jgi:hypothetical protein